MENLREILGRLDTVKDVNNDHIPPDQIEDQDAVLDCNICGGKGWLTPIVPTGHPDFGSIKACECRNSMREDEITRRLLAYSNLGYLSQYTFESLDEYGRDNNDSNRQIFKQTLKDSSDFSENPSGWLTITGPHGTGKTHLAAAIANRCIETGKPAFFIYVPDLIDHLRSSYANETTTDLVYQDLFQQIRNSPILILDGLSSRSITHWAQEKINQMLNHRASGHMPTVLTLSDDVSDIDSFIKSRIQDTNLGILVTTAIDLGDGTKTPTLGDIPKSLQNMTFETFRTKRNRESSLVSENLEAAFKTARVYANNPDGWLTFFSPNSGTGKTHLAMAIANYRKKQGDRVLFTFVPELMDHLRSAFSPTSNLNSDNVFNEIKGCPLLILDDLGEERETDWVEDRLYQLIVHRHNHLLPTVITTRTDFEKEAKLNSAIASRIQDPSIGQIVPIQTSDFRISA